MSPFLAKLKMPWWDRQLWALCYQIQRAYKLKCLQRSTVNIETYSSLKSKYQKRLRQRKTESWKDFCMKNFNGDLFGSLKKITGVSSSHGPPPSLSFDGATPLEPNQILLAFSNSFFPNALPNSPLQDNLKKDVLSRFAEQAPSFMLISQADILNAFDSLKPNQSPGTDGCPAKWLKCCSTVIILR
jgi:hypothetical protein